MAEVRTTSSTGGQKGVKPERHGLLPRKGLAAIARVFGFGAQKYQDHNWRRGYEWDKSIDALQRHIDAFVDGETLDEESGEPHLAHAGFHILVLLTWLEEQGEGVDNPFDTRWPYAMERARQAEAPEDQESLGAIVAARRKARQRRADMALDGLEPEEVLRHGIVERDSVLAEEKVPEGPIAAMVKAMIASAQANTIKAPAFGPDLLPKRPPIGWLDDYDAQGRFPR